MQKESSNILSDNTYKWCTFQPNDGRFYQPEVGKPYAIRLVNKNKVAMETDDEIVYVEDIKLGLYDGTEWVVMEPYPKYDFSPLSDKWQLRDGTIVSHFAEVSEELVLSWQHRFDPVHRYEYLILNVDDKHEKDVYNSLILAGSCLMMAINQLNTDDEAKQKLNEAYGVMCDLQATIDKGGTLQNAVDR